MRKLKIQTQVSVDGYMAGLNSEMDWMVWNWDDALKKFVNELHQPVDTIILGHTLAKGFIDHWAGLAAKDGDWFSRKMTDTPKVVFSRKAEKLSWERTTLAKGELAPEVNKLKAMPGKDIIAYGGSEFITGLSTKNLIDDYYLFVNPTAIGKGLPVFREKINLKLIDATPYECGITVMHYARINDK